jgi:cell division protein FtsQ
MELPLEQLELTERGSWRARLDTGANLELGRGTAADVDARVQRFLKTLTQVTSRYARPLQAVESADLRHENGYAIKLRGVSTLVADAPKK